MDESIRHVAANRKRYVALGVILLVGGIVIAALTFITIFGPILGLLLAVAGGIIIWKSGQEGVPPPDASGERKPGESVPGTVTTPTGTAPPTPTTPPHTRTRDMKTPEDSVRRANTQRRP